jgi:hypothetical protein
VSTFAPPQRRALPDSIAALSIDRNADAQPDANMP